MEEIIYYGCEFISTMIKMWAVFQLLSSLHDPKVELATEKVVCGTIAIVLSMANAYNNSLGWGLFSNNMLLVMSLILGVSGIILYETKFIQVWYESLICLVLMALSDFFVLALICSISDQNSAWGSRFLTAGIYRGFYLVVFSYIVLWGTKRASRWIQKNRQLWKGYWKNRALWLFVIAVGLSLCMIYFQRIYKLLLSPGYLLWMVLFLMSFMLCIVLIAAHLTREKIKRREDAEQLRLTLMERKYRETLYIQEEKEKLLHDMKNHLHAIRLLAEQGEKEKLLEYVDALSEKSEKGETHEWTGNTMLDLILNDKVSQARKENVEVNVDCDKLPDLVLSSWEICALFANLLDNSIEANRHQMDGEERWIHLICRRQGYMLGVTIMNPIKEDFSSENGFPDTTKEDRAGHGIGLYSIQSVLDEHEGRMMFLAERGIFKLVLTFTAFKAID